MPKFSQSANNKPRLKSVTTNSGLVAFFWLLHCFLELDQGYSKLLGIFDKESGFLGEKFNDDLADVCLPLVEETLKRGWEARENLISKLVVSRRRGARVLRCFSESAQGYSKLLVFWSKESEFLSKRFYWDRYNPIDSYN